MSVQIIWNCRMPPFSSRPKQVRVFTLSTLRYRVRISPGLNPASDDDVKALQDGAWLNVRFVIDLNNFSFLLFFCSLGGIVTSRVKISPVWAQSRDPTSVRISRRRLGALLDPVQGLLFQSALADL